MSQLAKIFTVVVLVLSVLFAAATLMLFAQRQNWRSESEKLQGDLSALKRDMENQKKNYDGILSEKNSAIESLESELRYAKAETDTRTTERDKALADQKQVELALVRLQEDHKVTVQTLEKETSRAARMEEELATARSDRQEAVDKMQQAMDAQRDAEAKLASLETKLRDLEKKWYAAEQELKTLMAGGLAGEEFKTAPEKINGRVTRIAGEVMQLNVGANDGVKEKYKFTVYRNGKYLGQLWARSVAPTYTIAEVIKRYTKDLEAIKEGDLVTTRIDVR